MTAFRPYTLVRASGFSTLRLRPWHNESNKPPHRKAVGDTKRHPVAIDIHESWTVWYLEKLISFPHVVRQSVPYTLLYRHRQYYRAYKVHELIKIYYCVNWSSAPSLKLGKARIQKLSSWEMSKKASNTEKTSSKWKICPFKYIRVELRWRRLLRRCGTSQDIPFRCVASSCWPCSANPTRDFQGTIVDADESKTYNIP